MSEPWLFVFGATHHNAPLEVRERLAVESEAALRADLTTIPGLAVVVDPREAVVDVRAAAPVTIGRLGHVGHEQPVTLGDLLQQHAQKTQPVGRSDRVAVPVVELELRVGAFAHDVGHAPT